MKMSNSIKELAEALVKFHGIVKDPEKESNNPFFKSKYVDLNGLTKAIRPALKECGLAFFQSVGGDACNISITTTIIHKSGEWIESEPLIIPNAKKDAQGAGSACTYGRRYSLSASLGIAWSEPDDDGNLASKSQMEAERLKRDVVNIVNSKKVTWDDVKTICVTEFDIHDSSRLSIEQLKELVDILKR